MRTVAALERRVRLMLWTLAWWRRECSEKERAIATIIACWPLLMCRRRRLWARISPLGSLPL